MKPVSWSGIRTTNLKPRFTTLAHAVNSVGRHRTDTLFVKSRRGRPWCGGLSQIYTHVRGST